MWRYEKYHRGSQTRYGIKPVAIFLKDNGVYIYSHIVVHCNVALC